MSSLPGATRAAALQIIGITPFETPDAPLVEALISARATGVLDLGHDPRLAGKALARLARLGLPFGVRIPEGAGGVELPAAVDLAIVPPGLDPRGLGDRRVLVQVVSLEEARAALAAGASGVVAKGSESGGRVGDDAAFILLQRLLGAGIEEVWLQGGIGLRSAAAVIAVGARGVVLDSQLALLEEATLPAAVREAVAAMDGSETRVVRGHRVYARPGIAVEEMAARLPGILGAGPFAERLLPAGQDASLARGLADQFRRVGPLVAALRRAVLEQPRQASELRPLQPGSSFATRYRIRYPIAQGPMTRVSDVAGFAASVAEAGALPFLALSLMRGDAARALCEETKARLGALTWGVGILGFVPPDLRSEQLDVIRATKPPVALIAGGRPAQARGLEEEGIPTFLHVPSPGLLELFLKDGARRFVFEGRECGGHVGPRSSLVLWETALQILMRFERPEEIEVLFAGGIHDRRSAALVATMAAPLAARGARIGVLMGSAYLFTREAVATGAILPAFQDEAVRCARSILVESAPGHATRCADTPFGRLFADTRTRMEAEGRSKDEIWEALERLNVGRLRVASKGIERRGDALLPVDEETQRREGMYMLGDVATLRTEIVGIDELHSDVALGATALLERHAPVVSRATPPQPADVAIVGMAGFFPDAKDLDTFWLNVAMGRDSVGPVPPERWNVELYYDPERRPGKTRSRWGGFLPDIDFDPLRHGIPPRSLSAVEPVQILALEAARLALEDAGYGEREFDRENTSVIFGAEAGTDLAAAYGFRGLFPQYLGEIPPELDRVLPKLTEDSFPGVLANVIAGRIANRLDLGGVNYTVDAACASSLAALELGCKELQTGSSRMVLVGGADLHNTIGDYLLFSSVHALSPRGRSATFDASADGIALGEGVVVLACKRLADAEADGDRIYALVRSVAGSSDGRCLGLTAPRKEGQVLALERAYARAGIGPAQIELVEAHGTGTTVGDKIELATLTEVYARGKAHPGSVTLGSVKSNIGHTKCAAGLAGVAKVVQALHRRTLPPTLHIQEPNAAWDAEKSPFVFRTEAAPWPSPHRRAAVSAFGFGGTNFHAVLESYDATPPPASGLPAWPAELFLFRDDADIARMAKLVDADASFRLRDLAFSQCSEVAASGAPVRTALVIRDMEELKSKLEAARAGSDAKGILRGTPSGKLAFLFPGQGSQTPGMLGDLFVAFPRLQSILEPWPRLAKLIFPGGAFTREARRAQSQALTDTRVAQPAIGLVELAAARLLEELGVRPDMMAGHSYGELAALCIAGAFPEERLPEVSEARARAILEAAHPEAGTMAACAASAAMVAKLIEGIEGVVVANLNGPSQTVIAGTEAGVKAALAKLEEARIGAKGIAVACAFHSPLLARAPELFRATLEELPVAATSLPVYANTTAAPHSEDPAELRALLAEHLVRPVRFVEEVERMYADGARLFVEVGPGRVLTRLVSQILGDRPHRVCSVDEDAPLAGLLTTLGTLAVSGHGFSVEALFSGRGARRFDLDHPPEQRAPTAWRVNGHRAVPWRGELPEGAMELVPTPLSLVRTIASPPPDAAAGAREEVVLEYLRNVREQAENQRQVLLSFLGHDVPAPVPVEAHVVARPEAPAVKQIAAAAPAPPAVREREANPEKLLLSIVSERTGYPPDMLDLDLDLEADLSIDSIKRMEVLGVLAERLGLGAMDATERDRMTEELAAVKTLRGILGWIERKLPGDDRAPAPLPEAPAPLAIAAAAAPQAPFAAGARAADAGVPASVLRFVPRLDAADDPATDPAALSGQVVHVVAATSPLADAVVAALVRAGAHAQLVAPGSAPPGAQAVVHLGCLDAGFAADASARLFVVADHARKAIASGSATFVALSARGGRLGLGAAARELPPGAGLSGLMKTVRREHPEARAVAVDLDPDEGPNAQAEHVVRELLARSAEPEVGYRDGRRWVRSYAPELLAAGDDASAARGLASGSVVLLTGGARGITARIARELARRYRPHLVLVGRTPEPTGSEDARVAGLDGAALRRRIVELGWESQPARADALARTILAEREIRATLATLESAGATVTYASGDVREPGVLARVVQGIYERHGRLDAVFHGAGVNEDKLLRDKAPDSFRRVVDTKLAAARDLVPALRDDLRWLVLFSSVAGAFGNRGQADYAAANDALDTLAHALTARSWERVVSVNWGPWGGGGMVSPELEREYARRGIGLIDPDEGVRCLLDELVRGSGSQVVLMRAELETMAAMPPLAAPAAGNGDGAAAPATEAAHP